MGVAIHSGSLFSIAKADCDTRKLLAIRSREVAVLEKLLYTLKSCSFYPDLSSWPIYSVWLFFGGGCYNGGSTVLHVAHRI